jgi:hypothetical protein
MDTRRWRAIVLAALAALAVLAYWRAASLPFISDDYVQIWLARLFGPVTGWSALAADPLYRCRTTSLILTYWTDRAFGLDPAAYNWSSILLHVVSTWLVFALGVWRPVGWRISALAAAFFAVYEGHQEAVIWYAALPELLVFVFSVSAFLAWVLWIQRGKRIWAALTLLLFVLALLSKESAVALVPLMLLPVWSERPAWRRWVGVWATAIVLALLYTAFVFAGKSNHLFFHDGTFSVSGPFWVTIPRSLFRLFWIWGALAAAALAAFGLLRRRWPLLLLALAWATITLIPYSFLTYMPFVPSRHTYLASVGLAIVAAAGALAALERARRPGRLAAALLVVVVGANCSYIWIRKQRQFVERAAPTEQLVEFARHAGGTVYVHCFPYGFDAADWAVQLRLGKQVRKLDGPLPEHIHDVFCFPAHPSSAARMGKAASEGAETAGGSAQ